MSPLLKKESNPESEYIPWEVMKPKILKEYTTDESIDITVSFLDLPASIRVKSKDKTQKRLEELESQTSTLHLTQTEYVKHIDYMHTQMQQAWESEDRVKSLKVAIQAIKILSDTSSVIKFYPSKFVLVSEILDRFGRLVYDRIAQKRGTGNVPLTVLEKASEMCKNWFYKIASIRELLPRIYTETALLHCYEFFSVDKKPDFKRIITRLSKQIRGCANPLVMIYTQSYLVRKAHEVIPEEKDFIRTIFMDFLELDAKFTKARFREIAGYHGITLEEYFHLLQPALEWILQSYTCNEGEETFLKILGCFENQAEMFGCDRSGGERALNNGMILNVLLSVFPPRFVTTHALKFLALIRNADPETANVPRLYRTLCVLFELCDPLPGDEQTIFKTLWDVVSGYKSITDYIEIAEVFTGYCLKFCDKYDLSYFIGDVLSHVRVAAANAIRATDFVVNDSGEVESSVPFSKELISIIEKLIKHYGNAVTAFDNEQFVMLSDILRGRESDKIGHIIMESAAKYGGKISNPTTVSALISHASTVYRSSTALFSSETAKSLHSLQAAEKRANEAQIVAFISKVDYGKDVEKQLNFLVECRHSFGGSDAILTAIISAANTLALRTLEIVGGKHTKRSAAFAKACVAFTFITIPTMDDPLAKLKLYTLSGAVAMQTGSIPQADGLFRSAVSTINEIAASVQNVTLSTEMQLAPQIAALCGTVLPMPGHPDLGPFYLPAALAKVFSEFPWTATSTARTSASCCLLKTLHAFFQEELPYHSNVDGNDAVFRDDPEYFSDLAALTQQTLQAVNASLLALERTKKDNPTYFVQALIETVSTVALCFDVGVANAPQTVYAKALLLKLRQEAAAAPAMQHAANAFVKNIAELHSTLAIEN